MFHHFARSISPKRAPTRRSFKSRSRSTVSYPRRPQHVLTTDDYTRKPKAFRAKAAESITWTDATRGWSHARRAPEVNRFAQVTDATK